ncbi:GspE/PulE family protein [Novispirillum itersonii]|uniref:GspE/PulE family protein n=1 Tax=Novispirillum itersonii TaxID=189 RepID=UPI001617FB62|nr:GspE/PulE family protein [Novispirillum itersonii]
MLTSAIGEVKRLFSKGAPPSELSTSERAPSGGRLFQALQASGLISSDLLVQATTLAARTGGALGQTLVDMGALSDEHLFSVYSTMTGLAVWDGKGQVLEPPPFAPEFLLFNRLLPIGGREKPILVLSDPEDDGLLLMLRQLAPDYELMLYPEAEIVFRLENHFQMGDGEEESKTYASTDIEHLKDLALEAPIIRQVNDLIGAGVKMGASDIHLEPSRTRVDLRYRVDGVLHNRPAPTIEEYPAVVSRIKILAQVDIAERRLPQDGRIKLRTSGKDVDIRVSTIPTQFGEDVALRLLDQKKQVLDLDQLGMDQDFISGFRNCLRHSHGLILVTGPTGSGKSTCLYSGLKDIINGTTKIITVEDPVEYEIPGLTQIQVNAEIGMTFAGALRSILRHDPDVVFIGEIRDQETADIAVQSALTGHLVLSTIHTNSAVGAISRLLNMGIPDYMISSSLLAVTGQRLLRRLCPHCRRPTTMDPSLADRYGVPRDAVIHEAVGCPECGEIGYRGRLPITELLVVTPELRHAILTNPTADSLQSEAMKQGFQTMIATGMKAVLAGHTTVEEVLRVAR